MIGLAVWFAAAGIVGTAELAPASVASLTPLGDLSGGTFYSQASAVSDDGSVVVGFSSSGPSYEGFRWTAAGGMVGLGPGGDYSTVASGVSGDGGTVVGRRIRSDGANAEAYRWTGAGGMVGLGFGSDAGGVSGDGSVVVGRSGTSIGAARWTSAGGWAALGDLPGGSSEGYGYGANTDGSVIVGYSYSAAGSEAFRWTGGGGMVGLGRLPGAINSAALDVSDDGSVIVGASGPSNGNEAFRWTSAGGMVGLGDLPGGVFYSGASAVSADGSVIVGTGQTTAPGGSEAFHWTSSGGMQRLWDVLLARGLNPASDGWGTLTSVADVSADGSAIVGHGVRNGRREAFVAVVPQPTGVVSVWNVNADGTWSSAANWTGGVVPNSAGAMASFGPVITAPRSVTVDSPKTVGTVTFDSVVTYTIAGTSAVTLDAVGGDQAAINVTSGSHVISAPVTLADDTTITVTSEASVLSITGALTAIDRSITKAGAGNVQLNNVRAAALAVSAGTVTILANGGGAGAGKLGSLALAGGTNPAATLDLHDNDLVVSAATPRSTLEAQVRSARNGGAWNRPGLSSSAARADTNGATTLGIISGAEYTSFGHSGEFSGQTYLATDALVKYTWLGDADFSSTVDFDDYSRIDNGYNTDLTGWSNGDFDYNGLVDFDDYALIDLAFNAQSSTLVRAMDYLEGEERSLRGMDTPALRLVMQHYEQFGTDYSRSFLTAVPEPSSMSMLIAAGSILARRRR